VGVLVLLGWQFDVTVLKSLLPGLATMKANTAAGFVLAGFALLVAQSRTPSKKVASLACSIVVALLGVMTLAETIGGWNLGIDEMIFADAAAAAPAAPGRMAPMTAVSFLLAGGALLLLRLPASRRDHLAQTCAVLMLALSLVAVAGYSFDAEKLYRFGPYVSVALHTALTFMVLSVGILLTSANRGWMPVFVSRGAGGVMLRRLLLPSLPILFAVAWLRIWGEQRGWYGTEVGLSLMVIASGALLSVLIWQNALALNRMHDTRELDQARLRESDGRLKLAVKSSNVGLWDWHVQDNRLYLSPEWKSQLGYGEDELSDCFDEWESRVHPDDKTRVLRHVEQYFHCSDSGYEEEFRLRHRDGSYRWIYARGELLRDAAGKPKRMAGCHVDITERKHAEETLRESAARTRKLQQRLMQAEENERRAIHRELHDRIGQDLATAKLNIELAKSNATAAVGDRLEIARDLVQRAIENSRDVMAELRPHGLDDHGLGVALGHFAETVAKRLPLSVVVRDVDLELRLPRLVEASLFRIAQEAINNLAKHASARHVEISLVEETRKVRLMIADDGSGFDATRLPKAGGYGFQIMRERADAVDAKLEVESLPGRGTRVIATLERTA
jgi:PAS domain S-box-containing protein